MTRKHRRTPFWRRRKPSREHDIAKLRPRDLKRGDRFETTEDAEIESERSELVLKSGHRSGWKLALTLRDCREHVGQCGKPYCSPCSRAFRRWFIGELLRLVQSAPGPVYILTVLLEKAERDEIDALDPDDYRSILRQRLVRAGLGSAVVIGGFENVYRARQKKWVLHINLVVIGGQSTAIDKFQKSFDKSEIERASMKVALNNPVKQLSYVLKFTTYHRPYQRRGSSKGEAKPLNAPEHLALVQWMSKKTFKSFMFLSNARRGKDSIVIAGGAD
jgi:hypothetical protein